jgi:hypothetical protein
MAKLFNVKTDEELDMTKIEFLFRKVPEGTPNSYATVFQFDADAAHVVENFRGS